MKKLKAGAFSWDFERGGVHRSGWWTPLFVDDDKNTRLFLKAILESENYQAYTAQNGEEALRVMDGQYIDLVVLDIMMPKMDGYEFTQILRESNHNLPILMVSAKQLPADKKKGFLVGTDDYMTKPIDEEEMLLRNKALLRRAKIASDKKSNWEM